MNGVNMDGTEGIRTNVGKVGCQLEAVNHLGGGLGITLDTEGKDTTESVGAEELQGKVVRPVGWKAEIRDPGHMLVLFQPFSESKSVVTVPLDPQAESLEALENQEGAKGVKSGSEVTEELEVILEDCARL